MPLALEERDLEYPCDECGGSGHEPNPEYTKWQMQEGGEPPPKTIDCWFCRGRGVKPTKEGLMLLRFMASHLPDYLPCNKGKEAE